MDISGTQSQKNIEKAFINESKAIMRYLIYADIAAAEGNMTAAELFKKMAQNETAHAKTWFKYIHKIDGDTMANLNSSASAENAEWKNIYPQAAAVAKQEGLEDIAAMFEKIASIECEHERRFVEMLLSEEDTAAAKEDTTAQEHTHFCLFCGYPENSPQKVCPVCGASDAFVEKSKS